MSAARNAQRRSEAVILFAVGPYTFAMPAAEVDEIRDLHDLKSISATSRRVPAKIRSTLVRERKKYYVVDANIHFRLLPSKASRVMILRGSRAAVSVDSIDRIVEVSAVLPLPRAFEGEERFWYKGIALQEDTVVPVVNPAAFLSSAECELADSLLQAKGASS